MRCPGNGRVAILDRCSKRRTTWTCHRSCADRASTERTVSVSAAVPPLVRFDSLASLPGLVHGVSTRQGGVSQGPFATLNLSLSVGDQTEAVIENRSRLAAALGSDLCRVLTSRQVHRANVFTWRSDEDPPD